MLSVKSFWKLCAFLQSLSPADTKARPGLIMRRRTNERVVNYSFLPFFVCWGAGRGECCLSSWVEKRRLHSQRGKTLQLSRMSGSRRFSSIQVRSCYNVWLPIDHRGECLWTVIHGVWISKKGKGKKMMRKKNGMLEIEELYSTLREQSIWRHHSVQPRGRNHSYVTAIVHAEWHTFFYLHFRLFISTS